MAWPVVTVASGGIPVTDVSASGYGTPVEEATNGFGTAVTYVASGGIPVVPTTGMPRLLATLRGSSVWSKLIGYYVFAQPTQAVALQNLKSPGTNDLTAVNSPTFSANHGFTGDGVSMHLLGPTFSAGFAPSGYATNNASVGVWKGNNAPFGSGGNGGGIVGNSAVGATVLFNNADANINAQIRANSAPSDAVPAPKPANLTAFSRGAAGSYKAFINKQKAIIATASTSAPAGVNLTFLRSGTSYTTDQICAAWVGLDLTDAEYATLVDATNVYLSGVGAFDSTDWGVDGAWTWYNDPRAIVISGTPTPGAVTNSGTVVVAQQGASVVTRALVSTLSSQGKDDHVNPALLRRASDGRIVAMYSKHSADATYYVRVSTNPDDISSWGTETNIGPQIVGVGPIVNLAYANLFQLSGESGKMFAFYRGQFSAVTTDMTTHYSTSADDGATWTQAQRLFWDHRPYFKAAQNGNARIDILLSDHNPNDDAGVSACSIYHCYYQGGSFFTSAGVSMGAPPFTQSQVTTIFDSTAFGKPAWNWDIIIDGSGNPVICFAVFQSASDHRYYQARWGGSSWSYNQICTAGRDLYPAADTTEPFYSGGVITDPTDQNTVYCSRQVDANGNINTTTGIFQLFKFVTANGGSTWTGTQLTFDTKYCFRPYIPLGSRTLLYCRGDYTSYVNYKSTIRSLAI